MDEHEDRSQRSDSTQNTSDGAQGASSRAQEESSRSEGSRPRSQGAKSRARGAGTRTGERGAGARGGAQGTSSRTRTRGTRSDAQGTGSRARTQGARSGSQAEQPAAQGAKQRKQPRQQGSGARAQGSGTRQQDPSSRAQAASARPQGSNTRTQAKRSRSQSAKPRPQGSRPGVQPNAARAQAKDARTSRRTAQPAQKGPKVSVSSSAGLSETIKSKLPFALLVLAVILLLVGLAGMVSCVRGHFGGGNQEQEEAAPVLKEGKPAQVIVADGDTPAMKLLDQGRVTASGKGRVTFAAFGDNLANDNILSFADQWGGTGAGDGVYDFSPLYENVRDEVMSYDIAFVNQETTLGGTGNGDYEWAGYPSYNTPDSMADALVNTGFRVINTNSNHTYDWWTGAIKHAQDLWNNFTSVLTIGSYQSQQDCDTIRVVECNGVRVAFLSYSYGQNGYEQSDLPNDYYAVPYSQAALATDVAAARKVADVVVVYLHAGTEYVNEPDETEVAWAQDCADNNVDLVIGSHVHVIQPMRYLTRADGGQMLTVYGLGDFVSGFEDYPEAVLSGEFSCDFVVGEDKSVTVDNVIWHPLIEHREGSVDTVYLLRDYTTEMAASNELLSSLDDPYNWIIETTRGVMGDDFKADVRHEF